ncbi:hypothetical protein M413DRAFT_449006 [Hebeloma cylindrosporum]|uniref:Uncharacterized protein n=1 Tax=Hebeloma cylindrosporum TaxID=76867 RepID=A0A0C3BYZ9_HEBCY|nr:hypothetical protein M413DRAFT_449006 [Hebeloma cylindrosporum h7]
METGNQDIQPPNANLDPPIVIEDGPPHLCYQFDQRRLGNKGEHLFAPPMQPVWNTMYYALALKGRGSPVHHPDPAQEHHIYYRRAGYSIGDVILLGDRGNFDFHFNTCAPADSPLNAPPEEIPEGFSPLFPQLDPTNVYEYSAFKGHTVLEGKSVRKFQHRGYSPGAIYDAMAEEKATLTLPDGVTSRDVIDVSCFRKYIAANAIAWYKFVNEVGFRRAINGDLRLVVGWDHCTSWSRDTKSLMTIQVPETETASGEPSVRYGITTDASGPGSTSLKLTRGDDPSEEGTIYSNQCVFVRTLNISVNDEIWFKLAEDFRPFIDLNPNRRPLPPGKPFTWNQKTMEVHPANGINALLLKMKPHAKFAITHDNDWISVLKDEDPCLPTAEEFLSRILEVYDVCEEDDVVYLEYKPQILYRRFLTHEHHTSLTLPLWQPITIAVGAVGYLSKVDGKFVTLFNARAPWDATPLGIRLLPVIRTKIVQTVHKQKTMKGKALHRISALLGLGRSQPQRSFTFPLTVGEKAAHLWTGTTRHRRLQKEDFAMGWFKDHIEKIVKDYGADHDIRKEDLVLVTGTLDTNEYALFVSACHREGSVNFDVNPDSRIGQPWGTFSPLNSGQFTSKVSQYGGPWETVLASCLESTT